MDRIEGQKKERVYNRPSYYTLCTYPTPQQLYRAESTMYTYEISTSSLQKKEKEEKRKNTIEGHVRSTLIHALRITTTAMVLANNTTNHHLEALTRQLPYQIKSHALLFLFVIAHSLLTPSPLTSSRFASKNRYAVYARPFFSPLSYKAIHSTLFSHLRSTYSLVSTAAHGHKRKLPLRLVNYVHVRSINMEYGANRYR